MGFGISNLASIPSMFASIWTAPPEAVLWDMATNDTSFDKASRRFADQQADMLLDADDTLWMDEEDALWAEGGDIETLIDDPLALEKAIYQKGVADKTGAPMMGMLTPYGPALVPEMVDTLLDMYPGAAEIALVDDDDWISYFNDAEDLVSQTDQQLDYLMDSVADAAESEGRIGDEASFLSKIGDSLTLAARSPLVIGGGRAGSTPGYPDISGIADTIKDVAINIGDLFSGGMEAIGEQALSKAEHQPTITSVDIGPGIRGSGMPDVDIGLGTVGQQDDQIFGSDGDDDGLWAEGGDISPTSGTDISMDVVDPLLSGRIGTHIFDKFLLPGQDGVTDATPAKIIAEIQKIPSSTARAEQVIKWVNGPNWASSVENAMPNTDPDTFKDKLLETFQTSAPGSTGKIDRKFLTGETGETGEETGTKIGEGVASATQARIDAEMSKALTPYKENLRTIFYKKAYAQPAVTRAGSRAHDSLPSAFSDSLTLFFLHRGLDAWTQIEKIMKTGPEHSTEKVKAQSALETNYGTFLDDYFKQPAAYRTGQGFNRSLALVNDMLALEVTKPNRFEWTDAEKNHHLWVDGLFGTSGEQAGKKANRRNLLHMAATQGGAGYWSQQIHAAVDRAIQWYRNMGKSEDVIFATLLPSAVTGVKKETTSDYVNLLEDKDPLTELEEQAWNEPTGPMSEFYSNLDPSDQKIIADYMSRDEMQGGTLKDTMNVLYPHKPWETETDWSRYWT